MVEKGTGAAAGGRAEIDVTIIMPCLNEVICLTPCIANAREALATMRERYGLSGEIVIAEYYRVAVNTDTAIVINPKTFS